MLGAVALLATCGVGGFFLVADEVSGHHARAAVVGQPRNHTGNPAQYAPLTLADVFPGPTVVVTPEAPAYPVLSREVSADCAGAVTGGLAAVLARTGCAQVVRATLRSPDGRHLITAGVLTLADSVGASRAYQQAKLLVDSRQGTFRGMVAGEGTGALARRSARVSWHVRGHYVVYCVLAGLDGRRLADTDPDALRIEADLLGQYLRGTVLSGRGAGTGSDPAGP